MLHVSRTLLLALAAPLLLTGCFLIPGKFVSTLDIRADRSFSFTYTGEVIFLDLARQMGKAMDDRGAEADGVTGDTAAKADAENEAKMRAVADALRKEPGYRSVEYKGNGLFEIDYALSGTLTHAFVFPFNTDAEAVFPFVAIELRGKDKLRVKAPGFGDDDKGGDAERMRGSKSKLPSQREGTFTLTTDATIVSQNNEDGVRTGGGEKTIVWKSTPLTKTPPTAVLEVAPLR